MQSTTTTSDRCSGSESKAKSVSQRAKRFPSTRPPKFVSTGVQANSDAQLCCFILTAGYSKYSQPKFIFTWMNVLSHDDNNDLQLADEDLTKMLVDLKVEGKLENTLVLIMADHGHRQAEPKQFPICLTEIILTKVSHINLPSLQVRGGAGHGPGEAGGAAALPLPAAAPGLAGRPPRSLGGRQQQHWQPRHSTR